MSRDVDDCHFIQRGVSFAATAQRLAHQRGGLSSTYTSMISCYNADKVLFTNAIDEMFGWAFAEAIKRCLPLFDSHGRKVFSTRRALVLIPLVCLRLVLFRSGQDAPDKPHGLVKLRHSPKVSPEHRSHDMSISSAPWPLFLRSSDLFCVAAFASSTHFS